MKVMQVLYSGLGGHGSVVTSLIDADKKKEWEHCLLFYGIEELLPAYREYCINRGIPFSCIKKEKGGFKTHKKEIRAILEKQRPDVVILHSPNLIFFTIRRYCRKFKKKIFVVEHTSNDVKRFPELMNGLISLLLARKVVYLSSVYQEQMRKKFWFFPVRKKSVVIPNGIDLEKFKPADKPGNENELHAGMIGRFLHPKRQALIVEALERIIQTGTLQKNLVIHFAGNGGSEEDLKDAVKNKGLTERVAFHGLLTEEEIIAFLGILDFYIHASDAETMCTAVMQAMACGLPVAASNIPGINNIVEIEINSKLFNNNNMDELISCIAALQDDEKRRQMGRKAREYAVANFFSVKTFQQYNKMLA